MWYNEIYISIVAAFTTVSYAHDFRLIHHKGLLSYVSIHTVCEKVCVTIERDGHSCERKGVFICGVVEVPIRVF